MSIAHADTRTDFGARLRLRRESLGLRKQALADAVGVSLTTIQQYENGQMPKGGYAIRLADSLRCSLDWLLAGRGQEGAVETAPRLWMVPMVDARLPPGGGRFAATGGMPASYAFRWDFLRSMGDPAHMVLLRASGDSMQPAIMHNDVVLVDQSQRATMPGRIYAVGVEDMVYLKILDAMPGKLVLNSANPAYAPIEAATREQMESLVRILGRAVWVGRELS